MRLRANKKIQKEFVKYKRKVMRHYSKEQLWKESTRISFYQCISEYFEYQNYIAEGYLSLVLSVDSPIAALWQAYLQEECLGFYTFDEIEQLLERILLSWNLPMAS